MLNLKVLSPEKTVLEAECRSVTLPTTEGQITVFPRHAPIYSLIAGGEIIARTEKGDISLGVGSGFANITGTGIVVLANFGVLTDEIDAARAQEAKSRAESLIANRKSEQDFTMAQLELSRSLLELKLINKKR